MKLKSNNENVFVLGFLGAVEAKVFPFLPVRFQTKQSNITALLYTVLLIPEFTERSKKTFTV